MFRLVVICGCLMAVAQAGLIGGGVITGLPIAAVQPSLSIRPNINAASSSSNIIRGIGPVGTILGGRSLIGASQGLNTILTPSGLAGGLAVNGYGIGNSGLNGYGLGRSGSAIVGIW